MGSSRNAWHKQIGVVHVSPPDSYRVEAGNAASLWPIAIFLFLSVAQPGLTLMQGMP